MTKKVAVIGGGIVGCITSFFLIKEGYEVTLVDQTAIGQEASWAGAGILSPILPWNYQDSVNDLCFGSAHFYHQLSEILKNKLPFSIYQNCNNPRCGGGVEVEMIYKDGDSVVLEYRDPHGKYVADVAVINSEKSRIIFEIKNTHRTTTVRPEPWFEFNARECFEEDQIVFTCVRNNKECIRCKALKEDWINNVPSMKPYFRDRHNAWKSLGAAKAHLTRMGKMGYRVSDFAVASNEDFGKIEQQVEKVNLMTGKKFMQSVNTPRACDPSSELYWSM